MRCEAKHPTQGTQCGLPAGHGSAHANGTICHPWNDPAPAAPHKFEPKFPASPFCKHCDDTNTHGNHVVSVLEPTVNIIRHPDLPPRTMMVSVDLYENIKEKFAIK